MELAGTIAAWRQSLEAVLAIGAGLAEQDWYRPTECPLWRVKDIYAHLAGGELWMAAGHPRTERGLAHIADEPVAQRRDLPPAAVLAELREVFQQRCAAIGATPPDPAEPAFAAWGQPVPLGTLWRHRAFDIWVHEQDIRRAAGRPGGLGTPGARVACGQLVAALPVVVAKRAAAPPGSVARFTVDGPVAFDHAVEVGADGRGRLLPQPPDTATSRLAMDWETFSRLGCGRIRPDGARVTVTGDTGLAERILGHLSVTP